MKTDETVMSEQLLFTSNCSWEMFLWKNSGRLHSFM